MSANKTLFLTIILLISGTTVQAQVGLDAVLSSVAKNNKTLQAQGQYLESQNLGYRTGLTPNDPSIGVDYMKGSPVGAGNQLDITVTQSFDFPTVYANRKQLSKIQAQQGPYQLASTRRAILLQAQLNCIDLVYLNKMNHQLRQRVHHAERIFQDYSIKLSSGEGNIIELNKTKINLINLQSELRLNENDIREASQKLTELNGGIPILFTDTLFTPAEELISFERLDSLYEANDPVLKDLRQQELIVQHQIDLNKSLWLPRFETGYHYQAILGQTYNGMHVGMTIPLWQQKNTVIQKEAEFLYTQSRVEAYRTSRHSAIKQDYGRYVSLRINYTEYRELMASLTSVEVLEKALKAGQISTIEYFTELGTYYATYNTLLKIEKEYYAVMARLNGYLL